MSQEIIKADPSARRHALVILIIGLILGILVLQFLMPLFFEYLRTLPAKKAMGILLTLLSLLSIIPLTIGFLMLRYGLKIIRTESFPPPGTKVIKDTPLITGKTARKRGIVLVILSVIILVCAAFNATVVPYMLNKLIFTQRGPGIEVGPRLNRASGDPETWR